MNVLLPVPPVSITDLLVAIAGGKKAEVAALLENNPELAKHGDARGGTALMLAVRSGAIKTAQMLLPLSDPLAVDQGGLSALHHAAVRGHADCVKLLLPLCDPSAKESTMGRSALGLAAQNGHVDCVKALMPASDASAWDNSGKSALKIAQGNNHWDCVDWLGDDLNFSQRSHLIWEAREAAALESIPRQHAMHERDTLSRALARDKEKSQEGRVAANAGAGAGAAQENSATPNAAEDASAAGDPVREPRRNRL